ncbi:MAG: leucyl aminopeptidase family protein [Hyphomicrobiaceae bacterium]
MKTNPPYELPNVQSAFAEGVDLASATPIYAVRGADGMEGIAELSDQQRAWAAANDFKGKPKARLLLPASEGGVAAVLFGLGTEAVGEPCGPPELLLGALPGHLPAGRYRLAGDWGDQALAGVAWGLGSYKFGAYKSSDGSERPRLALENDSDDVQRVTGAMWLGRDLINIPSNDMGPDELEAVARLVAGRHDATINAIVGDELLAQNYPLIHAVGRASTRAPRLIDITWGRADAPRITVVGKGVCFDTGGLDLKPAAGMLLMKKDMGGAAAALALADMVMGAGLDVRLRVLIPAVENSVAGNAFRPSDIVRSRAGLSVEIGNTDAEGRLVLADALALGDEDKPDLMMTFATLTGSARVALGPDLPPCFIDDDAMATRILEAGNAVGDPVWRMPFWPGYDGMLDSATADVSNTGDSPFAGAVTAALFMKRFVKQARHYAHFDIYGWRPAQRPLGPKGGEAHAARAMFGVIRQIADKGTTES